MTTKQTLARLQPLRSNVSRAHQHVLDKLAAGFTPDDCYPRVRAWRTAVKRYLTELQQAEVDQEQLRQHGRRLKRELQDDFNASSENSVDAWRADKGYEMTLAAFETANDLYAGHDITRDWLLGIDRRLQQTIHRNAGPQVHMPETVGMEAR